MPTAVKLFLKKKNMWENIKVFLDVSIPEIDWILFHSHGSLGKLIFRCWVQHALFKNLT